VKYVKWRTRTHLLYNITCLVKRSRETLSTPRKCRCNLFRQPALQYCRTCCLSCLARVSTFLDTEH